MTDAAPMVGPYFGGSTKTLQIEGATMTLPPGSYVVIHLDRDAQANWVGCIGDAKDWNKPGHTLFVPCPPIQARSWYQDGFTLAMVFLGVMAAVMIAGAVFENWLGRR